MTKIRREATEYWHSVAKRSATLVDTVALEQVRPKDWVRLSPFGLEWWMARQAPPARSAGMPPAPTDWEADWKYCPPDDLLDNAGAAILCSRRFALALEAAKVAGVSVDVVPHWTPNRVGGHAPLRLQTAGAIGRISRDVDFHMPGKKKPKASEIGHDGFPMPPVVFDGSQWTGHLLCWSDWFATHTMAPWRALLARGDLVHELAAACGGELRLMMQRVEVRGATGKARKSTVVRLPPATEFTDAPSWKEILAAIKVSEKSHALPDGRTRSEVVEVLRGFTPKPSPGLVRLLEFSDGPVLFEGAITFFPTRTRRDSLDRFEVSLIGDSLVDANAEAKSLGIALPDGWFLFAHRVGGQIFFAMSPDNLVCAVHVNGIVSGPDVPFEKWIMDQLKDLRFATENPGNWWSRDVLKP